MTPFIVCQSKDRVDAVPRRTTRWFRQDDVLAVLRRSVDELLGIHCGKKSKSAIPVKVIVFIFIAYPFQRKDLSRNNGDPFKTHYRLIDTRNDCPIHVNFKIHFEGRPSFHHVSYLLSPLQNVLINVHSDY